MSNLVVPDPSENFLNNSWLIAVGAIKISLFKNNFTPVPATVIGDFTKADFTGYADVTIGFNPSVTVAGKGTLTATAAAAFIMGVPGTGNTIYGYYVWAVTGTQLLWAERFDSAQIVANLDDEIDVTAVFTLFSEF
jgi:hypothetical protein